MGSVSRVRADGDEHSVICERSVLMYELMAETIGKEYGNCDSVAEAFERFHEQNSDLMSELEAETLTWTPEQRIKHQCLRRANIASDRGIVRRRDALRVPSRFDLSYKRG